jgi:hypothetical protein
MITKKTIEKALTKNFGHKKKTQKDLSMTRYNLDKAMKEYGLSPANYKVVGTYTGTIKNWLQDNKEEFIKREEAARIRAKKFQNKGKIL